MRGLRTLIEVSGIRLVFFESLHRLACHFVNEIEGLGLSEGYNEADGYDKMQSSPSLRNGKAVEVFGTYIKAKIKKFEYDTLPYSIVV